MQTQKDLVVGALMLGASPKVASKKIVGDSFDSAILPTMNFMLGRTSLFCLAWCPDKFYREPRPITAISYQIAIMLGILGSVSLTIIFFVQLGYQSFFND